MQERIDRWEFGCFRKTSACVQTFAVSWGAMEAPSHEENPGEQAPSPLPTPTIELKLTKNQFSAKF